MTHLPTEVKLLWIAPRPAREVEQSLETHLANFVIQLNSSLVPVGASPDVRVALAHADFAVRGPREMITRVDNCHLAVVDVSNFDPDVMYALGLLNAKQVPTLLIEARTPSTPNVSSPPAVVTDDPTLLHYTSYDDFHADFLRSLTTTVRRIAREPFVPFGDLASCWLSNSPGDIHIVTPLEDDKSVFANLDAPDYIYIDNLGDRDTLLEVYGFLRRYYPSSQVSTYSSDDFPRKLLERDLVVIGGPGVPDEGIAGNSVCRIMMKEAGCTLTYSTDGTVASFADREWRSEDLDEEGSRSDFGYYSRFPNPLNRRFNVVLINGLHTLGVLGAFRGFSDHPRARANFEAVSQVVGLDAAFEAGFTVQAHKGVVVCPDDICVKSLPV